MMVSYFDRGQSSETGLAAASVEDAFNPGHDRDPKFLAVGPEATCQALSVASSTDLDDQPERALALQRQIKECDSKLKKYRELLETQPDVAVVGTWISEVERERQKLQRQLSVRPRNRPVDRSQLVVGGTIPPNTRTVPGSHWCPTLGNPKVPRGVRMNRPPPASGRSETLNPPVSQTRQGWKVRRRSIKGAPGARVE